MLYLILLAPPPLPPKNIGNNRELHRTSLSWGLNGAELEVAPSNNEDGACGDERKQVAGGRSSEPEMVLVSLLCGTLCGDGRVSSYFSLVIKGKNDPGYLWTTPKMPPVEQSSKMMSSEKGDKLNLHAFAIKEERKKAAPTSTPTPPSGPQGGEMWRASWWGRGINILACLTVDITGF